MSSLVAHSLDNFSSVWAKFLSSVSGHHPHGHLHGSPFSKNTLLATLPREFFACFSSPTLSPSRPKAASTLPACSPTLLLALDALDQDSDPRFNIFLTQLPFLLDDEFRPSIFLTLLETEPPGDSFPLPPPSKKLATERGLQSAFFHLLDVLQHSCCLCGFKPPAALLSQQQPDCTLILQGTCREWFWAHSVQRPLLDSFTEFPNEQSCFCSNRRGRHCSGICCETRRAHVS